MIKELLSSRRFAPLFGSQFCSALNDNVLKNGLVILLLYGVAAEEGAPLVTLAGAVFIFPFFVLSALGGELADKFVSALTNRSRARPSPRARRPPPRASSARASP